MNYRSIRVAEMVVVIGVLALAACRSGRESDSDAVRVVETELTDLSLPRGDLGTWQEIWDSGPDLSEAESRCLPECAHLECGDDGCGGSCRECDLGKVCVEQSCLSRKKIRQDPRIICEEGGEVIPQTLLHFSGYNHSAPMLEPHGYLWSVNQPAGSRSVFQPSDRYPSPTFEVNVAGSYDFKLRLQSHDGTWFQQEAMMHVEVIPDEAIHIELLWHTPGDPDETDMGMEYGSDLDLHFVHPYAFGGEDLDGDGEPDPWFDQPFDCYWFNRNPEWGSYNPMIDDNPGLDRDDGDGAGPENINLNIPEDEIYRVGVNYWDDHSFGHSLATVKVYIFGELVFMWPDVKLAAQDMWEVCEVHWPSGEVVPVLGEDLLPKITPNYDNPFFN